MATENRKSDSGIKGSDTSERELKTGKNPSSETPADGGRKPAAGGDNNSGRTETKKEGLSGLASVKPSETIPTPTEPKKAKKKLL